MINDWFDIMIIVVAGFLGGSINAVVGSGSLLVYPLLLAAGIPPVPANGTNTTGMSVGAISAAWGYRSFLRDRMRVLAWPLGLTALTAAFGAWLVIALPDSVFETVVPWLILSATATVAVTPIVQSRMRAVRVHRRRPVPLATGIALGGIYGGYFGAGQGIVYFALLGAFYDSDVQRANAAKNACAAVANLVAAVVFAIAGEIYWVAAGLLSAGALLGGLLGARVARRLAPWVLRATIIAVGVVAALSIWLT